MTWVGSLAAVTAVIALGLAALLKGRAAPPLHLRHPDARELTDAGWTRGLRGWIAIEIAAVAAGATACVVAGLPLALAPAAVVAPSIWIRGRAEAGRERAQRSVPGIVTAAEAALRSGLSLPDALRRAADTSTEEMAAQPIRAAIRSFDLGASLDEALASAAEATADPRARLAFTTLALGIAERLPRERVADLLGAVGERLVFEERLGDEVRARAAGARQQQRLLAALVPGLALYLAVTMPVLSATLASDLGRFVLLPVAAALEVTGIVLGRRIVRAALA